VSIFDSIEKLITEHGSAALLNQQLAFAKDQFADLERKISDLQTQVGRLDAQLERERLDHKQTLQELQQLKAEHAEEVRIHRMVEFRRGKRTGGKWMAFCPKCHMPVGDGQNMVGGPMAFCTAGCGWLGTSMSVEQARRELEA
jgi:TolA-binding protein